MSCGLMTFVSFMSCVNQEAKSTPELAYAHSLDENVSIVNAEKVEKILPKEEKHVEMEMSNSVVVVYEEKMNIPDEFYNQFPEKIRESIKAKLNSGVVYKLTNNKGDESIYEIAQDGKELSLMDKSENNTFSFTIPENKIYKNFSGGIYKKSDKVDDIAYLVTDKLVKPAWKLSNESATIGGYKVRKASYITNDNMVVNAWYCDEITINDGPGIYWGLPGLILKVEAPDRTYTLVTLDFVNNVVVNPLSTGKIINENEYKKIVNDLRNNPTKEVTEKKHVAE